MSFDCQLEQIKTRIIKMLKLADNPGTLAEGRHAQRLATRWMQKYRLSHYDLAKSNALFAGSYEVLLRFTGEDSGEEMYESACQFWLAELANRVASVFPQLVYNFTKSKDLPLIGKRHFKCFAGIEDAAWSAAILYCSLARIVSDYIRVAVSTNRFTSYSAIESYAFGLVRGIDVRPRANDSDTGQELAVIQIAAKKLIDPYRIRYNAPAAVVERSIDPSAFSAGQQDGADIRDASVKLLH